MAGWVQPTEPALPDVCSVCSEDTTLSRTAPRPRSLLEGVRCPRERVWVSESHLTNRHAPCSYPPFAGRMCTSDVEPLSLSVMTSVCYSGSWCVQYQRDVASQPSGPRGAAEPSGRTSLARGLEVVRLSWRRDSSGCHGSPVSVSPKGPYRVRGAMSQQLCHHLSHTPHYSGLRPLLLPEDRCLCPHLPEQGLAQRRHPGSVCGANEQRVVTQQAVG